MFNNDNSNPTVTNSTFSGNTSAVWGGGMINLSNSSPTVINATFSGNSAGSAGGGIYNPAIVRNSILWGNTGPFAQILDGGASTISSSVVEGGFVSGTNIISADPLLGVIGSNGGYTQTIPLQAGSSAIDTADVAYCPATDQRGVARPQGGRCDIGAFELEAVNPVMEVAIDIKPGSATNPINTRSAGKIPVAILSTATFNAPAMVDKTSLTFGRTGDETSLAFCNKGASDVNFDGLPDLVCHFYTQRTGFQTGDLVGVLKGQATAGTPLQGSDTVKIHSK